MICLGEVRFFGIYLKQWKHFFLYFHYLLEANYISFHRKKRRSSVRPSIHPSVIDPTGAISSQRPTGRQGEENAAAATAAAAASSPPPIDKNTSATMTHATTHHRPTSSSHPSRSPTYPQTSKKSIAGLRKWQMLYVVVPAMPGRNKHKEERDHFLLSCSSF